MSSQLHRTGSLRAAGFTYEEVRRRIRDGSLTPVRRGTYLEGPWPAEAHQRHRLAVQAAARELSPDAVISHVSAAVLHGLPTWRTCLRRVHATRNRSSGGRRSRRVHIHVASLAADAITTVDGISVTTVARTVVDVARSVPFEEAVVVSDGALASGLISRRELEEVCGGLAGRRGGPRARRVVSFADGRSESVGESRSRVAIVRSGLPEPVLQWEVRDRNRRLLGRADFGWPEHKVAGEFDGRLKYGRLVLPGQTAGDVYYEEKRREDAMRTVLRTVVRWGWDDLDDFHDTATGIRHALG